MGKALKQWVNKITERICLYSKHVGSIYKYMYDL